MLALLPAIAAGPAAATANAASDRIVVTGGATVGPQETVNDVIVIDGPVLVAGHVTGHVVAVHGKIAISGTVDDTVTAVSERATLLPGAHVGGDLLYGDEKPVIAPGATVSGKVSNEGWADIGKGPGPWIVRFLFWLAVSLSTLVLGLALVALAPRATDAVWAVATQRTGAAIAWATGLFFGLPLATIIAIGSVLGLPFGIVLALALVPLAAIGYVTGCWLLGRRVLKRESDRFRSFLVGWGILRAIALIPFLGGLAWVVASAFGLGVLLLAAWYAGNPARAVRGASPPATGARPAPGS